jgi:hypothetical protein
MKACLLLMVSTLTVLSAVQTLREEFLRREFYLNKDWTGRFGPDVVDGETAERFLEAKKSPECRPVEQDPDGNWGLAVKGARVSLRLSKSRFLLGEPVEATCVIRNVSESESRLRMALPDSRSFVVSSDRTRDFVPLVGASTNPFIAQLGYIEQGKGWIRLRPGYQKPSSSTTNPQQ